MNTPVVLFFYKRSNLQKEQFEILRKIKPSRLFLISDGPATAIDQAVIDQVRQSALAHIDWECQVLTNFSSINLGLKERFQSGISWVFQHTDKAIFLEDDCLPDPSFFRFCDELLTKYQNDKRIITISGNNFQFGKNNDGNSYYFSKYPHIWGWATWKRVWDKYDSNISDWPQKKQTNWIRQVSGGFIISKFWTYIFNKLYQGKINTWDYQLTYLSFKLKGLNIIPSLNLVTNLGFGSDATNTKSKNKTIGVPAEAMEFPLKHPTVKKVNVAADRLIENLVYLNTIGKVSLTIKSILRII